MIGLFLVLLLTLDRTDFYAPRIEDLHRLPSAECVRHNLEFAAAYRSHLFDLWTLDASRRPEIEKRLVQLDEHEKPWKSLKNARDGSYEMWPYLNSVEWLGVLRAQIGPEAYHGGIMPDCVPLAWFAEMSERLQAVKCCKP